MSEAYSLATALSRLEGVTEELSKIHRSPREYLGAASWKPWWERTTSPPPTWPASARSSGCGRSRSARRRSSATPTTWPAAAAHTLPTRFTLMANKVPRFADDSGALASRMMVIRFQKSFLGKEDPDLTEKLKAELPGIANWALDGLTRLQAQGRFTETEASREESEDIAMQQSHVRRFMAETLDLSDPAAWTPFKRIYSAYTQWASQEGVRFPEDQSGLWANIRAVAPHLERVQRRYKAPGDLKARQCYGLLGAQLLEPDEQDDF